jgi:hypothetical protein
MRRLRLACFAAAPGVLAGLLGSVYALLDAIWVSACVLGPWPSMRCACRRLRLPAYLPRRSSNLATDVGCQARRLGVRIPLLFNSLAIAQMLVTPCARSSSMMPLKLIAR